MTTARDDGHLRYLLTAYLFGNLSDDGRAEVESHLAECAACRAELAELRETRALVEEALALPGGSAGGGEDAAAGSAPGAPYSFEAHRLERVLAAGRRGGFVGRRAGWYSAAALLFFALTAWLVLPNLLTARRKGVSLPESARVAYDGRESGGSGIPNLTQSASSMPGPVPEGVELRGLEKSELGVDSEAEARLSEIAAGGQGGGSEAWRLGRAAAPPASAPALASPTPAPSPGGMEASWNPNQSGVLTASPPELRAMRVEGGTPTGNATFTVDQVAQTLPLEGYSAAVDYDRKASPSGSKLDAESARHGDDRAAGAAAPKPAAPQERPAKRLEEVESAGEVLQDRADFAKKENKDAFRDDASRDELEVDGTLPADDAEKSKSAVTYGLEARKKQKSGPLDVIALVGKSENESAESARREWKEPDRRAPEGERQVALEEYAGERSNEPRYRQSAPQLEAGNVLAIPSGEAQSELREADKNPAGIYAFGADAPSASAGLTQVDEERRGAVERSQRANLGYDFFDPNYTLSRGVGAAPEVEVTDASNLNYDISSLKEPAPPETPVELGFLEVEESIQGLQEPAPSQIPVLNLMRHLEAQTGLTVNYRSPSADPAAAPDPTIEIHGEHIPLDPPMVAAILETNGYGIRRERLADGSDVLAIESGPAGGAGADSSTLALTTDPAIQEALAAAAREQAPQLGLRFAPTPVDPATLRAGLVLRAPRSTLEQVQRAVELAEGGAAPGDPGALAGWFSGVLAGTISPLPGSDLSQRAASRADEERTLRAYDHYKRNDPALDHRTFAARRLPVPAPVIGDEGLGQQGFRARYGVNPFVETERDRFSTFAMDVDTASYTRARTMISEGRLPDPAQVRTEEFVNAFPDPRAADPSRAFSVFCEGGPSPFGLAGTREASADAPQVEQVQITVKARDLAPGERRPAILTFAIDTSGSMLHGARLDLVRTALAVLLDGLAPDDRVGIVAYGTQAFLVLPHTPARERGRISGALESLSCHGSTNVEAGLDLAYRLADEVAHTRAANRVIVCSDGVATSGERDAAALLRKVRVYADRGIYLSVVGFGAERYDDAFLERIANEGNGQYGYVSSIDDAVRLFADNLPAALSVLARDAKIQVDFDPAVVRQYRLLGYENRDVKDEDFRNDRIDAGEVGPGSTVTAIYEVVRRPASAGDLGRVHLRYHDTSLGRVEEIDFPIPPGVIATRLEGTSERYRLLASVAELAELLRGSYFARDGAISAVLATIATLDPSTLDRPEVREFIDMTLRARDLSLEQWTRK